MANTIKIRGARTNNLKNLDLDIPRNTLTVVVGVSGSGKSSLVFDTVAAEASFQWNETYPPFLRNRLPRYSRPEADSVEGLSPVVIVDQRRLGGNARSTVGTITDTWTYLRLLFSRIGSPWIGESNRFSFNDPKGMCPACDGIGQVLTSDVRRMLDLDKSLKEGAILLPGFGDGQYWYRQYADIGSFDATTPLREWSEEQRRALLYGGEAAARLGTRPPKDYEGVAERFERIYLRTSDALSDRKQAVLERFTRSKTCPECDGARLNEQARSVQVAGHTISQMSRMEIRDLAALVATINDARVAPVTESLHARLTALEDIGLGYLSLDRGTTTLSGGESQRVKTVRHLGSSLTEVLYVFDEPTVGLHPRDVGDMTVLLKRLRDKGNTVLVVEHDPDVMREADAIIEIGPGAGEHGGELVFHGPFAELLTADTPTGRALTRVSSGESRRRPVRERLIIEHARRNNLKDITVGIPLGVLTVVTGVAGSGKSSLMAELLDQHPATGIDQRAIAANGRSTLLTYSGMGPRLRSIYARAGNAPAALFSSNSAGACPECNGTGSIRTDLAFMDDHTVVCEACQGRRYSPQALAHKVHGRTIADVEDLTVIEAADAFEDPQITAALTGIIDVGLGYLRLGQTLPTLSGGENQRLKIATELRNGANASLYVLDEPTTGLHLSDVDVLVENLQRLVDAGNTVIVVEHHLDVIRRADWRIDIGPEAGQDGGHLVFEGAPGEFHR
ncbi:excinuclease ABC subunit UvrA [Actinocorallia populi]|uniref:excinuclease ABC subunit UvrA n=1 Tax=Actinocorallia populi TaxID=2079200 RepID=UPI000D092FC2|nr:excinuclease ABC subunit UvrA [Actinocorallia populi]